MLPHFLNLLVHSWEALMKASSWSTFGFLLFGVLIPIAGGILGLAYYRFYDQQKWGTSVKSALAPLFLSLIAVLFVVSGAYFYRVVQIVYDDHQYFVDRTQQLEQEKNGLVNPKNLTDEIANLKKQIQVYKEQQSLEVRVYPLAPGSRSPNVPRMEYVLASGKIRTPADVDVTCDFSISDIGLNVLTPTGGSILQTNNQRLSEKQYRLTLLSPAWAPQSPLYVTVLFVPPVNRMPSCSFKAQ
jgi:hypothetical protein